MMLAIRRLGRSAVTATAAASPSAPPPSLPTLRGILVSQLRQPAQAASGFGGVAPFSGSSAGGRGGGGGAKKDGDDDGDPFGLLHEDSPDIERTGNVGSSLPPSYRRDPTTGKFTGEIVPEPTDEERRVLNLSGNEAERELVDRFVRGWNESEKDGTGDSRRQAEVAASIREKEMAMNLLGRKPSSVTGLPGSDGQEKNGGLGVPLSDAEAKSFQQYLKREHGASVDPNDESSPVPTQRKASSAPAGSRERLLGDASDPDMDMTWTSPAQRAALGDDSIDDPFLDLMPSDLDPAKKVNNRKAKRLPPELIHHNNLSLLRRYTTPGGQIMNRVKTRLGARDQRKIAKTIKRARALGIVPYVGQWKYEDHGNVHEKDLDKDKDWEMELRRRGLLK